MNRKRTHSRRSVHYRTGKEPWTASEIVWTAIVFILLGILMYVGFHRWIDEPLPEYQEARYAKEVACQQQAYEAMQGDR